MKHVLAAMLMLVIFSTTAMAQPQSIPPEQKKALEDFYKSRAASKVKKAKAHEKCTQIAMSHSVSPTTAKAETAAAYAGCMAGKGYPQR